MIFSKVVQNYKRKRYSPIVELELQLLRTGVLVSIVSVINYSELELPLKECHEFLRNANIDCSNTIKPADCNTIEKATTMIVLVWIIVNRAIEDMIRISFDCDE